MQVLQKRECLCLCLKSAFLCVESIVFPPWRGLSLCCTCLPSWCAVLSGEKSSWWYKGLAVSWNIEVTLMCKIKMKLYVCVCVVCVTFLPRAALAVWGLDIACGCQLLFFFLKTFSSCDTRFDSLPFRLKFLWLEHTVLATANYPSTWLNCDREKEA